MRGQRSLDAEGGLEAGFTFVGLLILLAIIGLASALTVTAASLLQQRADEEELLFIGREFANAFRSYYEASPAGNRQFPAKLEELLKDPRYPGIKRHLRRIYPDPISGQPWAVVTAPGFGGIMGVHSVSGKAPLKVANFELAFVSLEGRRKYSEWVFGFAPATAPVPKSPGTPAPPGALPSTTTAPFNAVPAAPNPVPTGSSEPFAPSD
jgi:type II secretory pathway pseudopilin PulG